jgi:hypothetical protein
MAVVVVLVAEALEALEALEEMVVRVVLLIAVGVTNGRFHYKAAMEVMAATEVKVVMVAGVAKVVMVAGAAGVLILHCVMLDQQVPIELVVVSIILAAVLVAEALRLQELAVGVEMVDHKDLEELDATEGDLDRLDHLDLVVDLDLLVAEHIGAALVVAG